MASSSDASTSTAATAPAPKRQRTLAQLWKTAPVRDAVATFPAPPPAAARAPDPPDQLYCIDLFCGCGGFSIGAEQAGHKVVLAIDSDDVALRVHRQNHPKCETVKMCLGAHNEERLMALVEKHRVPGRRIHVHGSPPCQAFSAMRNLTKGRSAEVGMCLVEWYINFVRRLQPDSWSFEQVCMRPIREFLRANEVCFEEFDLEVFGVPQTRRRTLAGTPALIHALRDTEALRVSPSLTPADVLARTMPRAACYVRASGGKKPPASATVRHEDGTYSNAQARWARSVRKCTWTVLCAVKPVWLDRRYRTIRVFKRHEICTLQTLPDTFKCRCDEVDAVRLVGNVFPPLVVKKLMLVA